MRNTGLVSCLIVMLAVPAVAQHVPLPFGTTPEARRTVVAATPDRKSMTGLSASQRAARADMQAGKPVTDAQLIALAERGDGLAAQHFAARLIARGQADSHASDLAYYSAIAVRRGRIAPLAQMIEAMRQLDPTTEPKARVNVIIGALYPQAWAGNPLAIEAVVAFNGEGRLFGALSDGTRDKLLAASRTQGDGRTDLQLALGLLQRGALDADQQVRVLEYLDRAAVSDHPGIQSTALNLKTLILNNKAAGGCACLGSNG